MAIGVDDYYRERMERDYYQERYPQVCLPKPKKEMSLSILAKKLLDSDTKTLVKAGFLDNELELTEEGIEHLNILVLTDYKEELVKQARKVIKENKESEE